MQGASLVSPSSLTAFTKYGVLERKVWDGLNRRQKRALLRAAGNRHRNYRPGTITKTGRGPSGPSEKALARQEAR